MPLRLLAIGLPLTIVAGALAGVALLGELALIEAILLSIVLAPTDAALGRRSSVTRGSPRRIRQGLNVESGLNDGICVPLLLVAIAVAEAERAQPEAARRSGSYSRRSAMAVSEEWWQD